MSLNIHLPGGYACEGCGHWNKFPVCVYAHWRSLYRHACENCGCPHTVLMAHGVADYSRMDREQAEWFADLRFIASMMELVDEA